jgi:alkylation response protein AidB-like acyl-CoA dehydrogenase
LTGNRSVRYILNLMTWGDAVREATTPDQVTGEFRLRFRRWASEAFPAEWRTEWFASIFPPGDQDQRATERSRETHRILHEAGWIAPGWPIERGGRGCGLAERVIIAEELATLRVPRPIGFQGIDLLGPTLIEHASEAQRSRFLPRILSGDDLWCQGYSEPDAGSDLAAMRTTARRVLGGYVVAGRKVWTSYGSRANWCFLLARTGSRESRHRGLTFFLTPMSAVGVSWRPIRHLAGGVDFGELLLDDVFIPDENVVGAAGEGWRLAMSSLGHERLMAANVSATRVRLDSLREMAEPARMRPAQRARLAELSLRLECVEELQRQAMSDGASGSPAFAYRAALLKVAASEIRQGVAQLAVAIIGQPAVTASRYGMPVDAADPAAVWAHEMLDSKSATIYAGTSEIQRNIVAELALGLPRG